MQAILDAPNWLIILTMVLLFIGVPALFLTVRYLSWWEYTHRDARIRSRYERHRHYEIHPDYQERRPWQRPLSARKKH